MEDVCFVKIEKSDNKNQHAPIPQHIFNIYLIRGDFPFYGKASIVMPLIMKQSFDHEMYKITDLYEKIMLIQIY